MKKEHKIKPIHPFAARMAPEIAFEALQGLPAGSIVLDPMAGSGTVLRTISELGYNGVGFDIDPLSVIMSRAWTTVINEKNFSKKAEKLIKEAGTIKLKDIKLPWIDKDKNTKEFIKFWFAQKQVRELRKLSYLLSKEKGIYSSILKVAFSRLIICKSKGASLAADVSHSRPHKVRTENDFDVLNEYKISCSRVIKTLNCSLSKGKVRVNLGDARKLNKVEDASVDYIITSPPYLNALDYMRGHKLALVWLGYQIDELSDIRGKSVGAEKAPEKTKDLNIAKEITKNLRSIKKLPNSKINMVYRYALDVHDLLKESSRVLKTGNNATFVVGNSCLLGVYIKNTEIVTAAAKRFGFSLIKHKQRRIPENKRYLPLPKAKEATNLSKRMRTESVLTFMKN